MAYKFVSQTSVLCRGFDFLMMNVPGVMYEWCGH